MRTKNSIKNVIYAFIGQFLGIIISFIARYIFIKKLGAEYLGITGLFNNILNILSFTELGIGTSIAVALYEPLENKNYEKLKALMRMFKKIYVSIGFIVILLGLMFLPFYRLTMSEVPDIPNLDLIYILFVLINAVSYFYSYKRTLVISDQKRYIASFYRYLFYFILNVVQILVLILFENYIFFLFVQLLFTLLENYMLSRKVDKIYIEIKNADDNYKISNNDLKKIKDTIKNIIFHKFGGIVLKTTDNICISKLLGVFYVGIYSNYYMITSALDTVISQVFNSVVASVGNLNVSKSKEKMHNVFNKLFFMNQWIYCFVCVCIYVLSNDFITLWLGEEYVINNIVLLAIVGDFYIHGMRKTCLAYREATGNYKIDRFSPIVEAIINIISSIIFTLKFGLIGVFIGTILSCLLTCFWIEPLVIYRKSFNLKSNEYFLQYIKYFFVFAISLLITVSLTSLINEINFLNFILKCIVSLIIPNVILSILFVNNKNFKYYFSLLKKGDR